MSQSLSQGHRDDDDYGNHGSSSMHNNLKFVVVIGELHPVPTEDLLNNAAISFLTSNTDIQDGTSEKKAKWCLSTIPHDHKECNFIHRTREQAMKHFFVVGEPAPVPIDHLQVNAGWKQLHQQHVESMQEGSTTPYPRGQWCLDPDCPDIANCLNLHPIPVIPNDRYISVIDEEDPVPVSELLLNRRVAFILSAAADSNTVTQGRWCINKIPHDPLNCSFLHRRREKVAGRFVPVEGEMIPASCLFPNSAVEYLLANPQNRGRWCGRRVLHSANECKYVHLALEEVQLDGHTEKTPTAHLKRNSALMYMMSHRGAVGRVCTATETHPVEQCRFIHFKDSHSHGSHLQIQAQGSAHKRGNHDHGSKRQGGRHSDTYSHQSHQSHQSYGHKGNDRHHNSNDDRRSYTGGKSHRSAHPPHPYDSYGSDDRNHKGYNHYNNNNNGNDDYNNNSNRPHLGPDDVNVEGEAIHVSSLCDNAALLFLKAHRGSRGKWCWMLDSNSAETRNHDPFTCRFVHPK